ncbi:hypothetical protein GGX14DRAFT_654056 [Mycena pura]|uniref:Cupin type-2 domain-containing protein n=1 Tax=Mycena pura TaxID=153505 RepID=A0AAD6VB97_9AGAR|nr:hypothetical protein GGX14DRAFT_654056 [Mycena pura]
MPSHKRSDFVPNLWCECGLRTDLQNPLRTRVHATGQGDKLIVPPHWHAAHDERHVVLKGRVTVTQDGVQKVIGPDDGICVTPRGVVHSLEGFPGEELILEETATLPEDTEQKTIFFRNMYSPGLLSSPLRAMQLFYYGDMYPKLPTGFRWLERPLVVVIGGWIAPLLGYQLPDKRLRMNPDRFPPNKKS